MTDTPAPHTARTRSDQGRVALIGAGVMGETILSGLLRTGWSADQVIATDLRETRRAELTERYGIATSDDNAVAVQDAAMVVLAVKPQDLIAVLDGLAPALPSAAAVVSIVAGIPTEVIESRLAPGTPVVRVMPNTPAQVGEGMSAISAGAHATDDHLATVHELMSAIGAALTVPESYQDAVTAVSGSGPAYIFAVVDAMAEAGVQLGLPRDIATTLAVQTVLGAATLLRDSGEHPAILRERVTSPGGTTAAALRRLDDHRLRAAFADAMEAARDRSRELARSAVEQAAAEQAR